MNDYLIHYGVLGMKWGVRRYQNADGTLTAEGRARAKIKDINTRDQIHKYGGKSGAIKAVNKKRKIANVGAAIGSLSAGLAAGVAVGRNFVNSLGETTIWSRKYDSNGNPIGYKSHTFNHIYDENGKHQLLQPYEVTDMALKRAVGTALAVSPVVFAAAKSYVDKKMYAKIAYINQLEDDD